MREQDKHLPFTQKKRSQSSNKSCLHIHEQQNKANKKRLSIPLVVDETFRFIHEKNVSSTCKHANKKIDSKQFSILNADSNQLAYAKKNQSAMLQGIEVSVNQALNNSIVIDQLKQIKLPLKYQQNNNLASQCKQQFPKKDKKCCRKDKIHYKINKQNLKQIFEEELTFKDSSSQKFTKFQLPSQIERLLQNKFLPFFVEKFTQLENSFEQKVGNLINAIMELQEKNLSYDQIVSQIRNQNQYLKAQILTMKKTVGTLKQEQTSSISMSEQSCCGNLGCFSKSQSSCVNLQDFESIIKDKFEEFFDRKINLRDNSWQTVLRRQNLQLQNSLQAIKLEQQMTKKKLNKKINDLQLSIIDLKQQKSQKYTNNCQTSRQSLQQTGNIEKIERMINIYNENFLDLEERLKKIQSSKK